MKKLLLLITLFLSALTLNAQEFNVTFANKSYTVEEEQKYKLVKYLDFLFTNPQLSVVLEGHTDSVGKEEDNFILSKNRAETIKSYFVSQGILDSRIKIKACGETQPKVTNDTALNREINRRVEAKTFVTYE